LEDVGREGPPLLAEALRRMRAGEVRRQAGYDGEYGVVRMFDDEERLRLLAQTAFSFWWNGGCARRENQDRPAMRPASEKFDRLCRRSQSRTDAAIAHGEGPLLIVAVWHRQDAHPGGADCALAAHLRRRAG